MALRSDSPNVFSSLTREPASDDYTVQPPTYAIYTSMLTY